MPLTLAAFLYVLLRARATKIDASKIDATKIGAIVVVLDGLAYLKFRLFITSKISHRTPPDKDLRQLIHMLIFREPSAP